MCIMANRVNRLAKLATVAGVAALALVACESSRDTLLGLLTGRGDKVAVEA